MAEDETKQVRISPEEWTILRIALDNYVTESRFGATFSDELKRRYEEREALQKKMVTLGLWEKKPFSVVMRVETSEE